MQVDGPPDWVKLARFRRGLSVRAAAQKAGLSNTTWGRIESREVDVTPNTGRAIAEVFGWAVDWWESEDPPAEVNQPDGEPDRSARLAQEVRALRRQVEELAGVVPAIEARLMALEDRAG